MNVGPPIATLYFAVTPMHTLCGAGSTREFINTPMQFVGHNAQFHSRANTDYSVLTLLFNLQGLISWQGGWSDLTYIIDVPRQEHELPKVAKECST